jgi:hypothetical protein
MLGAFHDSSRGNVQCCPGTQAERDYIASLSQSSPSRWRTCDIATRSSRRPGFASARSWARCRRWCRVQLPLPFRRTQLRDVFRQSTCTNYRPGFHPSVPGGAARGGCGNCACGRGQPRSNQDVHFTENPVEEAEEHGYEEEPTLRNNMNTKAEGHGGEPSQEEQHWLENNNLDDQE